MVEGNAPDYEQDNTKKELSYLEKILALTEETNAIGDSTETNENSDEIIENFQKNTGIKEGQESLISKEGEESVASKETEETYRKKETEDNKQKENELSVDHSKIVQSQFPWIVEKDYGSFEVSC